MQAKVGIIRATRNDIYRKLVSDVTSECSILEIYQSRFKSRGTPVQQIGQTHTTDLPPSTTSKISQSERYSYTTFHDAIQIERPRTRTWARQLCCLWIRSALAKTLCHPNSTSTRTEISQFFYKRYINSCKLPTQLRDNSSAPCSFLRQYHKTSTAIDDLDLK